MPTRTATLMQACLMLQSLPHPVVTHCWYCFAQAPVASQLLDGALKEMVAVACCDVGRRGTKSFLAFASATGAVCAFNVAYVQVEGVCVCLWHRRNAPVAPSRLLLLCAHHHYVVVRSTSSPMQWCTARPCV